MSVIDNIYPGMKKDVMAFLEKAQELDAFIYSGYRSFEKQEWLYEQGRTRPGEIVTYAKPGQSWHNFGTAIDMAFKNKKNEWTWDSNKWKELGKLGESFNLHWGGRWGWKKTDKPHFERNYGQTLEKLKGIYLIRHNILDVYAYLDSWQKEKA